jgi:hypothetical protein
MILDVGSGSEVTLVRQHEEELTSTSGSLRLLHKILCKPMHIIYPSRAEYLIKFFLRCHRTFRQPLESPKGNL